MWNFKKNFKFTLCLLTVMPCLLSAQSSSINTFSPFTFYGIGDLTVQGPAYIRSMGGAGTAYRDPSMINYLNPAALSAIPRKSFLFNFGMQGSNYYLSDSRGNKTSFNTFNVKDVAIQFPLGKGIAVGVSVTPYSSIGYRVNYKETDEEVLSDPDIIDITYKQSGSGDLNQAKLGVGWEIISGLSIGAEAIYYFGNLERANLVKFNTVGGSSNYANPTVTESQSISRVMWNFGMQYRPFYNMKRMLMLGATYQIGAKLNPETTRNVTSNHGVEIQSIYIPNHVDPNFRMPTSISAGAYYMTQKMSVGFDYNYKNWAHKNTGWDDDGVRYRNTNTFMAGIEYTPNRFDIRRFMKRVTYRFGLRYSDYYLTMKDKDIKDMAVTAGVGIPLSLAGMSNINVGFEYGTRGKTTNHLIKENYFKISIGLSLFGTDDWFKKYKYE